MSEDMSDTASFTDLGGPPDITNLFISDFSRSKDEYGKEIVPRQALSFDRVMEGRLPTSNAPFFQFPYEILSILLENFDEKDLAALALVDRDCRQLARSRQFSTITLDYSPKSYKLLRLLYDENEERQASSQTSKPSLGACIRRITIALDSRWLKKYHGIAFSSEFLSLPEDERQNRLVWASSKYCTYLELLRRCLTTPKTLCLTLPYLELLDWEVKASLSPQFFDAFPRTNIQYLKLHHFSIGKDFELVLPSHRPTWPLKSLYLEFVVDIIRVEEASAHRVQRLPFSIIRNCSSTLEKLVWKGYYNGRNVQPSKITDLLIPTFPNLRMLELSYADISDAKTLVSLLGPKLSTLVIKYGDPLMDDILSRRGRLPNLVTLVWGPQKPKDGTWPSTKFLRDNPQIRKLSLSSPHGIMGELLQHSVLPLLASSFHSLKSLDLVWEEQQKSIPSDALQIISQIQSLEQLRLSAGTASGWRHDWLVDHNDLRKYLQKLPYLKKLALSRDSYKTHNSNSTVDEYYIDVFSNGRFTDFVARMRLTFPTVSLELALRTFWEDEHQKMIMS